MCEQCAGATNRNHWAGYYFFLSIGVLMAILIIVVVAIDWSEGRRPSTEGMTLLIPIGAPFAMAWWIRRLIERGRE